jgi:RNA polymerase sigma-70 factor (ECF subfamily)
MAPDAQPDVAIGPATLAPADTGAEASALAQARRRLEALAVKLIWNRHDAEEIAQEAFRLAVAAGQPVHSPASMPWLLRTVANLCLNHRRRSRPVSLSDYVEPPSHHTLSSPEDALHTAERLEALRNGISRLPPQQRLAVTLRMLEEMPYEQIARVMELSVEAIRTHVHLARRALAASLSELRP